MKKSDAAKVLGLFGCVTIQDVKTAYRRACSRYHPDRNVAGLEMMKAVNAAYEVLKGFEGDVEQSTESSYPEDLNRILSTLVGLVGLNIEICGAWIWVTGDTKPHKDVLGKNGLGMFYASKKKAWYYRPDDWVSKSRGKFSMSEIRDRYGSEKEFSSRKAKEMTHA